MIALSVPASAAEFHNFIDELVFGKMAQDGVEPAPASTDYEFLRRVSLDLTGRIPSPADVEQFADDDGANKRSRMIDQLMASAAYVDRWTLYFGGRFQVTSNYYQLIGIPGRNLFHGYLRRFVQDDRSWKELATELITATGDTHRWAPGNFILRGVQQGDPIQDTWDALTNNITTEFLGIQTQCVSCHNGRNHLEQINAYLSRRRRDDFMRLSAFLSRIDIYDLPVDVFNQQRKGIISDRSAGVYHGLVPANNPGSRPTRNGTYEPVYMFTGEKPASGEWRKEFARILTADRQFARAEVNYIWAQIFGTGIVDPPVGWDLDKLTVQPSNPELIEALADFFIANGFRHRPLIRLIADSSVYQLSSKYGGTWKPAYAKYPARHEPRRLTAEEIYDSLVIATQTETPILVEDWDEPVYYASQLPDPSEPRGPSLGIAAFLTAFGRGDWWRTPSSTDGSVVQSLYLMNDAFPGQRTLGFNFAPGTPFSGTTRVARLLASNRTNEEMVRQLFLASLGRPPLDAEMAAAMRRRGNDRDAWLSDLHWTLVNRTEFLFNH